MFLLLCVDGAPKTKRRKSKSKDESEFFSTHKTNIVLLCVEKIFLQLACWFLTRKGLVWLLSHISKLIVLMYLTF